LTYFPIFLRHTQAIMFLFDAPPPPAWHSSCCTLRTDSTSDAERCE
jgi:hypothetical protein